MTAKKTHKYNNHKDLEIARSVLKSAVDGINQLSETIGQEFIDLVNIIYNMKGKVIISGMGKSGHIAKKISATLASTGTTSFFVHPGEASHGDLGVISKDDLVILLSNSGETAELKDLVNYTKRFNIPLVAFVRKPNSSLAESANIKVIFPQTPEALGFDAPTTSTTMMLALGDALALALLEKRGFTRDDFRVFHPGGRLGASLVKVQEIMHKGTSVPIAHENSKMQDVIKIMTEKNFGCIAILDKNNNLSGIITDGDLRRNILKNISELKAYDIMAKNPATIKSTSLSVEALDLMNRKSITNLIVTEGNSLEVVGIVHMHDCLRSGASPNNL